MTYYKLYFYYKLDDFLFWSAYYNLGSVNTHVARGHFKGEISLMTQRSKNRVSVIDHLPIFPRRYALENDKNVTNDFRIVYIFG